MADTFTKPSTSGPMATQPVITVTMITTFVSAVFAAITLAVPGISPEWEKAVLGIIAAAWPFVTAYWTWHKVYAPSTVREIVNDTQGPPAPSVDWQNPATWPATPHGASEYGTRDGDA